MVAVGKGLRCLYTCNSLSQDDCKVSRFPSVDSLSSVVSLCQIKQNAYSNFVMPKQCLDLNVIHARLGHASVSKMLHIEECKHFNAS